MKIKYKSINLNKYRKVYVISDIHGDIDIFNKFIGEVKIEKNELLIINGDIFEKGKYSLKLINRIFELSKIMNIEVVLGNNDTIFNEWGPYYNDEDILRYIKGVNESILIDMANELNLKYETINDISLLHNAIQEKYNDIIGYLKEKPHILESKDYIFVHAGIEDKSMSEQNYEYLLIAKEFANKENHFNKKIIVGHWPTSNYSDNIIKINPYFNNNVISIDGGVSLKKWSQLNYLIIDNDDIKYSFIDNHPRIKILNKQEESVEYFSLLFPKTSCQIIKNIGDKTVVYLESLQKEIIVSDDDIYHYRGNTFINDYTNYHMNLEIGDIVYYIDTNNDEIMIKKDGIVSLYKGEYCYI